MQDKVFLDVWVSLSNSQWLHPLFLLVCSFQLQLEVSCHKEVVTANVNTSFHSDILKWSPFAIVHYMVDLILVSSIWGAPCQRVDFTTNNQTIHAAEIQKSLSSFINNSTSMLSRFVWLALMSQLIKLYVEAYTFVSTSSDKHCYPWVVTC